MGPLVTEATATRRGYVDAGVAEGATLVVDGRRYSRMSTSRRASGWARPCSTNVRRT